MNQEVFAGIKVLVAMAGADGVIHASERRAIANVLDGEELPDGHTLPGLLGSPIDLELELSRIVSAEARRGTYAAACAMVYVDGEVSDVERALLVRVWKGLLLEGPHEEPDAGLDFMNMSAVAPGPTVVKIFDAEARSRFLGEVIARAAAFSAALATASLPVSAETCLFTHKVRLARNIGRAYGHETSDAFWRAFVVNVVGAAAPWFAISSLLARVPGSPPAASAYAGTFALGKVTTIYFESGEDMSPAALREAFALARVEGLHAATEASVEIDANRTRISEPLAQRERSRLNCRRS